MIDPTILETLRLAAEANKASVEACLQVVSQLLLQQSENQYLTLDDAAAALGSGISPDMLKERCTDGRFRYGVHFINTSDGKRSNYLIKVGPVRAYFETDPAKRPSPRRAS